MDRLARSLVDLLSKMQRLGDMGVEFVSLTEKIDTTTPGGRLIFHVLASIAEFERDLIRERTQAGVRAAMARGVKFGQDPILSPAQRKQAQKLRDKKVSLRLIAEQFDVSHSTIRAWTVGPGRTRTR
jgi:DNA invertase Pin-like site-specific DNA recombinase